MLIAPLLTGTGGRQLSKATIGLHMRVWGGASLSRAQISPIMSAASLRSRPPFRATLGLPLVRRVGRWLAVGIGYLLILVGAIGTLLPGHLGAPILAIGLVVALRSSFRARRQFIGLQQRHPKILFPVRRLLRREPEVIPVAWQALLRIERGVLPRRWRFAVKTRRRWR